MTAYASLLIAHLLLFAYWLGGDLGVFYSSYTVADPKRSVSERQTAASILIALDRAPRVCLILMLPVGVSLAAVMQQIAIGSGLLAALWIFSLIWLVMLWRIETTHDAKLKVIDGIVRCAVIAALLAGALGQLLDMGGPVASDWVALKMLIFAVAIGCGLMIRKLFGPFGPAFGALVTSGSTPEIEQTIDESLRRTRPFVILIWISLIAAAAVAAVKPAL
ncbi:MAG: hypothetical protein AAF270_13105 [Pseudomonadota bacterium]